MAQEDKIKREIDRIGLVLAKLLNMALKKDVPYAGEVESIAKTLQSELDIDLGELLEMNDRDDVRWLVNNKGFSVEHVRGFANVLYDLAQKTTTLQSKDQLLRKARNLYQYIDANSGTTVFFDVKMRLKEI
jgi:hypothetical protein